MASISSFTQFHCKPIGMIAPQSPSTSKPSVFPVKSTIFASKIAALRSFPNRRLANPKRKFVVRAVSDDEWGEEKKEPLSAAPAGVAVVEDEPAVLTETDVLKKQLVDSFYGTNRGLGASSETRAEVVELITQLEAKNPTPAPRRQSFTVQNSVVFSGPLATTSFSTNAKFEVRSPKRVQIKFEEGIIGTPQLTDSIVLPENVEFLGQKIDLTPFKGLITSLQDTASSVVKSISSQPPLKFSLANSNAESWLLTTYLDSELRISRGEAGSIFVLIKEGSPLLKP
nr:plastid-lipid-associated protein, chloroplastic [Ipomoea batatas]